MFASLTFTDRSTFRLLYRVAGLVAALLFTTAPPTTAQGAWENVESGVEWLLYGVDFAGPELGFVTGDYGTILRSTDAGATSDAHGHVLPEPS